MRTLAHIKAERKYYKRNRKRVCRLKRQWRKLNYEKYREIMARSQRKCQQKLKREIFTHYGLTCVCCGESNIAFLTLGHIEPIGGKRNRIFGGKIRLGQQLYVWLRRNGFPDIGVQTECYNCNMGKAHNGNVCPHTFPPEPS